MMSRYEEAKQKYAALGVDTDAAIQALEGKAFPSIAGRATT